MKIRIEHWAKYPAIRGPPVAYEQFLWFSKYGLRMRSSSLTQEFYRHPNSRAQWQEKKESETREDRGGGSAICALTSLLGDSVTKF